MTEPRPFAITLDPGSSLANKTGSWRTERPVYADHLPPCNNACPAGENIQQWLFHAEDGSYEDAWRQIMADNPFPAVMGRICYRPCETACNRATLDEAVGINSVERFLGDEAIKHGWTVPVEAEPSGKHVLVVGAGLSGGVRMRWLSTIKYAGEGRIRIERMELDDTGFPQPTGQFEELEADGVVLALGKLSDLALLQGLTGVEIADGIVKVGPNLMTGHPGVFAGRDMVPSERTATVAIGHGKKAARHIDAWLRGTTCDKPEPHELATFDRLNTWYYSDAPATVRPKLVQARRISTFDEVTGGLTQRTALYEARRCLSCGNCLECDNCYGVCPDNAVIKLGPGKRYQIDLDFCKGCGLCAAECPSGVIDMIPERT